MLDDVLDRYFPADVTDDWPEGHIEAEGLDIEKEDYFRSLVETASSAVGEKAASDLEGLYARNYDVIILRDQDEDELAQVHEHEYIHRVHAYESRRPFRFSLLNDLYTRFLCPDEQDEPMDAETFLEETWYEPDTWERRVDPDLAERYDEPVETTEAIVLPEEDFEQEHEDYYAAVAFQAIDFIGTGDWYNGLEEGEIRADLDLEMDDHSEVLTHYLVHVEGVNHTSLTERGVIDPDELEPVDDAMQRLDKEAGYDRAALVRTFASYDSIEDLVSSREGLNSVREDERPALNGYLVPHDEASTE